MATKGNFSRAPSDALSDATQKNYVAVHVEQGVPVLDRDLNLIGDLVTATLRSVVQRHIGDGVAGTSDFAIRANGVAGDFAITAGTCVVRGISVTLPTDTSYLSQTIPATANPLPPLSTPTAPRIDTVYLDLWLDEIDDSGDGSLGNGDDVGIRTSTRLAVSSVVRVFEPTSAAPQLAPPPAGHAYHVLARLSRPAGGSVLIASQILDQR